MQNKQMKENIELALPEENGVLSASSLFLLKYQPYPCVTGALVGEVWTAGGNRWQLTGLRQRTKIVWTVLLNLEEMINVGIAWEREIQNYSPTAIIQTL